MDGGSRINIIYADTLRRMNKNLDGLDKSGSVSAQQSAFAVGVLSDLNAFHRSTGTLVAEPMGGLRSRMFWSS